MFYGWMTLIGAIVGIFLIDKLPLIPKRWTHKIRVSLGLLAVIIAILKIWPYLDSKLKIIAAVGLGASGYAAVDRVPLISSVVPDRIKTATKVGIVVMAIVVVIINVSNVMLKKALKKDWKLES